MKVNKLITNEAIKDVIDGAKNYEFWMTFGMNDIKAKYRRSKLGQLWITLSVAVFIFVIGLLYGRIFDTDSKIYLAYLGSGYIVWLFIAESITTGLMILAKAKTFLLQRNWPISSFIYRLIYRELMIVAHHAVLLPIIFLILGVWPGFGNILLALFGFALTTYTAFWVAMILAIVTLRYRDIPPIIGSLMRMAFFATPIIWVSRDLGTVGNAIIAVNPFTYFIAIVRDPLIGHPLLISHYIVAIGLSAFVTLLGLMVLSNTKHRLTYWL